MLNQRHMTNCLKLNGLIEGQTYSAVSQVLLHFKLEWAYFLQAPFAVLSC
jgi:hypothetical protein